MYENKKSKKIKNAIKAKQEYIYSFLKHNIYSLFMLCFFRDITLRWSDIKQLVFLILALSSLFIIKEIVLYKIRKSKKMKNFAKSKLEYIYEFLKFNFYGLFVCAIIFILYIMIYIIFY
ncbi:MAG: hypothetical protein LBR35_01095, partial [Rickettsiales bacterium]|nr:hypothetical protein [Rickettsiales bacterium]